MSDVHQFGLLRRCTWGWNCERGGDSVCFSEKRGSEGQDDTVCMLYNLHVCLTLSLLQEFRNWMYSTQGQESVLLCVFCLFDRFSASYDFFANCNDPFLSRAREQFAAKHEKIRKSWEVESSFPSDAVIQAYFQPVVDKDTEVMYCSLSLPCCCCCCAAAAAACCSAACCF
eukprot:761196-Hanusia_phi.AAC.2